MSASMVGGSSSVILSRDGGGASSPEMASPPVSTPHPHVPHRHASPSNTVQVMLRLRPCISGEFPTSINFDIEEDNTVLRVSRALDMSMSLNTTSSETQEYSFQRIFPTDCDNEAVYAGVVPAITSALAAGKDATLLMYGQTGSGKTFTMGHVGPRLVRDLFDVSHRFTTPTVTMSVTQIYVDVAYDLLRVSKVDPRGPVIKRGPPGLLPVNVTSADEAVELLLKAESRRAVAPHAYNQFSSRSHSVATLTVRHEGGSYRLSLVDLAGSERVHKTGATGDVFKEGRAVNSSLSALSRCIQSMASHAAFIPFRENVLTRFLEENFKSTGTLVMLCCASTADRSEPETKNTLSFADVAKTVKLGRKTQMIAKSVGGASASDIARLQEALRILEEEHQLAMASVTGENSALTREVKSLRNRIDELNEKHNEEKIIWEADVVFLTEKVDENDDQLNRATRSMQDRLVKESQATGKTREAIERLISENVRLRSALSDSQLEVDSLMLERKVHTEQISRMMELIGGWERTAARQPPTRDAVADELSAEGQEVQIEVSSSDTQGTDLEGTLSSTANALTFMSPKLAPNGPTETWDEEEEDAELAGSRRRVPLEAKPLTDATARRMMARNAMEKETLQKRVRALEAALRVSARRSLVLSRRLTMPPATEGASPSNDSMCTTSGAPQSNPRRATMMARASTSPSSSPGTPQDHDKPSDEEDATAPKSLPSSPSHKSLASNDSHDSGSMPILAMHTEDASCSGSDDTPTDPRKYRLSRVLGANLGVGSDDQHDSAEATLRRIRSSFRSERSHVAQVASSHCQTSLSGKEVEELQTKAQSLEGEITALQANVSTLAQEQGQLRHQLAFQEANAKATVSKLHLDNAELRKALSGAIQETDLALAQQRKFLEALRKRTKKSLNDEAESVAKTQADEEHIAKLEETISALKVSMEAARQQLHSALFTCIDEESAARGLLSSEEAREWAELLAPHYERQCRLMGRQLAIALQELKEQSDRYDALVDIFDGSLGAESAALAIQAISTVPSSERHGWLASLVNRNRQLEDAAISHDSDITLVRQLAARQWDQDAADYTARIHDLELQLQHNHKDKPHSHDASTCTEGTDANLKPTLNLQLSTQNTEDNHLAKRLEVLERENAQLRATIRESTAAVPVTVVGASNAAPAHASSPAHATSSTPPRRGPPLPR